MSKRTFNENIAHWYVSNVTNMSFIFHGAAIFNQQIFAMSLTSPI
jgi:hypothetical protein